MIPLISPRSETRHYARLFVGTGVKGIRPVFPAGSRCGHQKLRLIDSATAWKHVMLFRTRVL